MSEPVPYAGKWTCIECGDTSDNEHAPCSCEKDTSELIEEVASLRRQRDTFKQQRDTARADAERQTANCVELADALRAANDRASRAERDRDSYAGSDFERQLAEARAEAEQLRAERDAAVHIATAAASWARAGGNPCGECDDPYLCTECALFHAAQAWRTTKGDAGK